MKVLYYIIFFMTLLYSLYFAFMGVFGFIKSRKFHFSKSKKQNYFAIIIPARNEAEVIGNLLDSLNNLNYPQDKYSIYVVPNNCTDDTAKISKKHKANVIECTIKTKTKGDVLNFVFSKLESNKEIDAYIIFDADNVVHPDFLMHMNNCLENGFQVAQGFRDAKNPSDNWLSGSYTLFYLYQNIFFNKSRMGLNGSATINGTGFMIKKSIIDEYGFDTKTLTEDIEFTGQCAMRNHKIAFVEDAITYDEHPNQFVVSWKQRKRWSAGIIKCMTIYSAKLFNQFIKTKKLPCLDMSLIYLGPLIQILSFINLVMLICFRICNVELNDIFSYFFATGWLFFIVSYTASIIVDLFMLYYKKKKPKEVISGIILFLVFIFTWIPINIICLVKKHEKWEEIKHKRNIRIDDVIK